MKTIETRTDLYLDQLRDLFSAESQVALTLGSLAEAVSSDALRKLLRQAEDLTSRQKDRIRDIFERYGSEPTGDTCQAMLGLIHGGNQHIAATGNARVRDLLVVAHCVRVKHYEIAGYRFVASLARRLGLDDDAARLTKSLEEERAAIQELVELSQRLPLPDDAGDAKRPDSVQDAISASGRN